MKIESQIVSPCRVKLVIRADASETHADVEAVVARYMRDGRVRGFRPGKVPRAVIERAYRADMDTDIRKRLVGVLSRRAVEEQKLALVAMVDVTDILFSPETGVSFVLACDVAPEFKLPKYQKIPLTLQEPSVSDADVGKQVETLRRRLSQYQDGTPEEAVATGDLARVDFTAVSDGKPLKERAEDATLFSEGTGFWMQVSEPEMIPGVSLAVAGMKIGEEKTVQTRFPKDFRVESLQGVKAVYTVKLAGFRRVMPMTDEELCAKVALANPGVLRDTLREQMLQHAASTENERRTREVIAFLLKKADFDLPASEVEQATGHTIQSMVRGILNRGGTRDEVEKNRDQLLATATATARDRVRLRYILARIAEDARIEATEAELDAKIEAMSRHSQLSPSQMRTAIESQFGLETLRANVRAEKTLDFLVNSAK